jgi:hypothetical protein
LVNRAHIAAACGSIALIAATLSPLLREPSDDGFPLSTYPMFATRRLTTLTMHYALGEGAAGGRIILGPELVGTGEVLQAMRVVDRAVAGGTPAMGKLCEAIAARVAADPDYAAVTGVRIVTGTHDAVEYLSRDHVGRELERARCTVVR